MTTMMLIAIALMWFPVALFLHGKGEAKGTGAATGVVGIATVVSAILQAAVFNDAHTAGLLLAHGIFYLSVSYALLAGLENGIQAAGNVSLTVAFISAIYAVIFLVGTPKIPQNYYLGVACIGYAVLTTEVWLFAYGKFPGKGLAWSLIIWVIIGLWIPAFSLHTTGKLPF